MELDLDTFVTQLSKLKLAVVWVVRAIEQLEKSPQYRGSFDLHVPPPGSGLQPPDPQAVEVLKEASQGMVADQRAMHREVIGRATLVYAWAVLENLLEDCVRCVYAHRPVALLEHASEKGRTEALRSVLADDWRRSDVAGHLLEAELRKFRNSPFSEWPRYFERRLGVAWPTDAFGLLQPIADRRNAAAHGRSFSELPQHELLRDINDIYDHGAAIAIAVGERHGLTLRDATYRFAKGEPRG